MSPSRLAVFASLAALTAWGLVAAGIEISLRLSRPAPPVRAAKEPEPPPVPSLPWLSFPDRLRRGETLEIVLRRNGLTGSEVHQVARALAPHLNLRLLASGDEVEVRYGPKGRPTSILVHRGRLETYAANREESGWRGARVPVAFERREVARRGVVKENLFASMDAIGETAPLTVTFAEVFAWDFDFYTQSRAGDRFSVLVEKIYREGEFVGYGALRAARYQSGDSVLVAYLFEDGSGTKGYYDAQGRSLRKAFLRAPLEFRRISSRFSFSRLHPILGRRTPHLGVDYTAPAGTPVRSVADGEVVALSRSGGGGKTVAIRHRMGYRSHYLHLSRFAAGLRAGKRVKQKEVIGYVGSSGLSTGPHLDFRLTRHGRPVNPLKEIFPPGPPVPAESMPDFRREVEILSKRLDQLDVVIPLATPF